MNCTNCSKRAVIKLQHGGLCKTHFINYFEEKVFKTINKFKLIDRNDKLCVATSGGKDSLAVLYLTNKYIKRYNMPATVTALAIDEGIANYREKTLEDLKQFCTDYNVPLEIASFEEDMGKSLDQAVPILESKTNKKPCHICGVWRRYLLNKYAQNMGTTKVITGHNLDDESQAIVMNLFKANTKMAGRLGPISGEQQHDLFIQRVKPLYLCSDKEVKLYTVLKGWKVQFTECPNARTGYRHHIQEMLNDFEANFKGTKQGIIKSYLALQPNLPKPESSVLVCIKCKQASNQDVCNACKLQEVVNE